MYVNYFDRLEKLPDENPTIGVLLCADKNKAVVKFTLPENNKTIMASQYQLYLPSEKQLLTELKSELKHYKDNCSNNDIKGKELSGGAEDSND